MKNTLLLFIFSSVTEKSGLTESRKKNLFFLVEFSFLIYIEAGRRIFVLIPKTVTEIFL